MGLEHIFKDDEPFGETLYQAIQLKYGQSDWEEYDKEIVKTLRTMDIEEITGAVSEYAVKQKTGELG